MIAGAAVTLAPFCGSKYIRPLGGRPSQGRQGHEREGMLRYWAKRRAEERRDA
jgi:hypothetical protein